MRELQVHVGQGLVGTLTEGEDLWSFEYEAAWAHAPDGFDLAPGLPRTQLHHRDGATHRPVQWYFDNLLPEELLRQAISREAGIRGDDAFALLEYLGAESAGSLTLLPPGGLTATSGESQALSDEALSARIARLPRSTLTAHAPKRMSLAGAQHKLLVTLVGGQLHEPVGATASTHILKPGHPVTTDYPGSVTNEYVTMRLAAACGLAVPRVEIRFVPEPVYIVERFDRRLRVAADTKGGGSPADVERLHIIDACQLLDRSRGFKHTGASLEALRDIISRTTNKAATRLNLLRWLIFNITVGNDDCHLKNLSFFVGADGIRLAPHYDLLSTSVWNTRVFADDRETWPHGPMGFTLPDARTFAEVSAASVIDAAAVLGVPGPIARRILREVVGRLPAALDQEIVAMQTRHGNAPQAAMRYLAAEATGLRVMHRIIVPNMLERLAPIHTPGR